MDFSITLPYHHKDFAPSLIFYTAVTMEESNLLTRLNLKEGEF
jgi:hypothetical protein